MSGFLRRLRTSPDPIDARQLAFELFSACVKASSVLTGASGAAGLGRSQALLRETLAYGLCALDLQLQQHQPRERKALMAEVRLECGELLRSLCGGTTEDTGHLLATPANDGEPCQFDASYALLATGASLRTAKLEAFVHFKELTGLESDVLVGRGTNLASLVYYVAVHATAFGGALADLQTRHRLQQAARESCRFLDARIRESLDSGVSTPGDSAPARLEAHSAPGLAAR